jgi:hypothetical protein
MRESTALGELRTCGHQGIKQNNDEMPFELVYADSDVYAILTLCWRRKTLLPLGCWNQASMNNGQAEPRPRVHPHSLPQKRP